MSSFRHVIKPIIKPLVPKLGIKDIPNEVMQLIMENSNIESIISFCRTCKFYNGFLNIRVIKELIINKPDLGNLSDKQIDNLYNIITNNVSGNLYINQDNRIPFCEDVKSVEFGEDIIVIILKNGLVYGIGNNKFGILGTKPPYKEEKEFIKLPIEHVKQISIGDGFILYLDEFGYVYRSGRNQYGELGNTKGRKNVRGIEKIPVLSNIKAISAANHHSLFLDYNGNVYSTGKGDYGQLGLSDIKKTGKITKIIGLPKISKIKATNQRSYFITKEGIVYYCGIKDAKVPELLDNMPPTYKIVIPTGSFLDKEELIITVGGNVYVSSNYILQFKLEVLLTNVIDVCFINPHTLLCLSINGTVYEHSIGSRSIGNIYDENTVRIFSHYHNTRHDEINRMRKHYVNVCKITALIK